MTSSWTTVALGGESYFFSDGSEGENLSIRYPDKKKHYTLPSQPRPPLPRLRGFTAAVVAAALSASSFPVAEVFDHSITKQRFDGSKLFLLPAAIASEAVAEMESYRDLEADWDGDGTVLPSASAIDDAIAFVGGLPSRVPLPQPNVSADGIVGWYWHVGNRFANVTFTGNGRIAYYAQADGDVAKGIAKSMTGVIPADLLHVIKQIHA